ncbi:MAG: type II secretory pathway component GspD/PulD (secretin) [Lentisphaeria bacterium]|jgi:type II secretory pathway component GspD/PulD (secretin)
MINLIKVSRNPSYYLLQRFIKAALLCALLQTGSLCWASNVIWSREPYTIYARGENLQNILVSLGESQGMHVDVDPSIIDLVSLSNEGKSRQEIFQMLVGTYGLAWHYDGYSMFVDKLANIETVTIQLKSISPAGLKHQLSELGVLDANMSSEFNWRSVDHAGIVFISGIPSFLGRIKNIARSLDVNKVKTNTVYKWQDKKGHTHYSSDPTEAPYGAKALDMGSGSYDSRTVEAEVMHRDLETLAIEASLTGRNKGVANER